MYCDAIVFSFEIASDTKLKRECEAVVNEACLDPKCEFVSTVGTRTKKAPSNVFQR